jgi:hypothetical protein
MESKGSLYSVGSLTTVAGETAKCRSDLVEVLEVRQDRGGIKPAGNYTFLYANGNESHELGTRFCVHKTIILIVKTA